MTMDGWDHVHEHGIPDEVPNFDLEQAYERAHEMTPPVESGKVGGDNADRSGFTYEDPDRGEYGREEPDVDSPQPVTKDSRVHQALTVLSQIEEEHGEDHWIPAKGVYNWPNAPDWPNPTGASKSLSRLFLQHALCERMKDEESDSARCLYRINEAGKAELRRIGPADLDD